jgi:hypothetical protein
VALPVAAVTPRRPAAEDVRPLPDEYVFVRRMVTYGFVLRVLVALILHVTELSRRFAPDEDTYVEHSWQIALYWAGDVLVRPWRMNQDQPLGYFYLNGFFFYLFGKTEIPIKIANAAIGAMSARYVYLLSRQLFGTAVARRAITLFVFFPSLVLWSALNIRDVWVVFLILFISGKSAELAQGYSHIGVLKVVGGMFVLTFFRDYLFYVVALPPILAVLIGRSRHFGRNVVLATVVGLGIVLLAQKGAVSEKATERMSLEAISEARRDMAVGASAFHGQVDISTPGRALAFLPVGIAYFLFSPFPWEITSLLKMFSLPEMILIYALTPSIVRGVRYAIRERLRDTFQILLLTGLLTTAYALGEGNVGTLYRHRAQVIGFYLMFAAVGLQIRQQRRLQPAAA